MTKPLSNWNADQAKKMERYYAFHAKIYDLTRVTFLFGRNGLVRQLPFKRTETFRLLEVGCGTGHNLARIHRQFPKAQLWGIDVSKEMLKIAEGKAKKMAMEVELIHAPYGPDIDFGTQFDAIVFAYSLSMINPYWQQLLEQAQRDLKPGGIIATVDFHDSRFGGFKKWMGVNHVRMDGHLHAWLIENYPDHKAHIRQGYGGVWEYFSFVGRK